MLQTGQQNMHKYTQTGGASIYSCIGKGSFGAALASSISIGCAVTEHLQAKTLDKREAGLKDILDEKMYLAENTSLKK